SETYQLPRARIVSNGETYVAGWQTAKGFVVRRMSARSGVWIDRQPVVLPKHAAAALASNGSDAVAVSIGVCSEIGFDRCLFATRIPMSGDITALDPTVIIHVALTSTTPTIASDSTSYLVAWTNGPTNCGDLCYLPQQIFGIGLAGDATALDPQPRVLD